MPQLHGSLLTACTREAKVPFQVLLFVTITATPHTYTHTLSFTFIHSLIQRWKKKTHNWADM